MKLEVVIVVGSESDLKIVDESKMLGLLTEAGVSWELSVISAHRDPETLRTYITEKEAAGTLVYIGIAGLAAALPGAIAALVYGMKPVLAVALSSPILQGLDALLSEVRMPPGRPVAVCGLDDAGLKNAALMACAIVALTREEVCTKLVELHEGLSQKKQPRIARRTSDTPTQQETT